MVDIIHLPENLISKQDKQGLESFAAHSIALGRATRWCWDTNQAGDGLLKLYRGGANEQLAVLIYRDREQDQFHARDGSGQLLVSGALDHVLAWLDRYLASLHQEPPPSPA